MKKNVVIIFAVLAIAALLFVPANAKVTDPPDPICNICTKLDTIIDGLGDGGTTGSIVYSSGWIQRIGIPSDVVVIVITAPGLTETMNVEIRDWRQDGSVFDIENLCGTEGIVTLGPAQQIATCMISDTEDKGNEVFEIVVPENGRGKVQFYLEQATSETIRLRLHMGDFGISS
jgi:hypothetical protein